MDVQVGTTFIYEGLFVGPGPRQGRFGMSARTGASIDDHVVDNLTIETVQTWPTGPVLRSAYPLGVAPRGDPNIRLVVQDGSGTQLNPDSVALLWAGCQSVRACPDPVISPRSSMPHPAGSRPAQRTPLA